MRSVVKYEANDGSVWDVEDQALAREALIAEVAETLTGMGLRDRPNLPGCGFENGGGFVQQPTGSRDAIYAFMKRKKVNRDTEGPLGRLLYRAMCFDASDREWGQPYFAQNPYAGQEIAL